MTDTMIERVARGLEASFKDQIATLAGKPFAETGVHCPQMSIFERYARAAIQAMREPTPGMIEAAWQTTTACCPDERMGVLLMDGRTAHGVKMLGRWRAMIDAALEEDRERAG